MGKTETCSKCHLPTIAQIERFIDNSTLPELDLTFKRSRGNTQFVLVTRAAMSTAGYSLYLFGTFFFPSVLAVVSRSSLCRSISIGVFSFCFQPPHNMYHVLRVVGGCLMLRYLQLYLDDNLLLR